MLDHYGNKSVNMAASNQLLASAHLLLWQHSNEKSSLEDARKLLEESLQVYQQVKGVGDPDTLKCHVSFNVTCIFISSIHITEGIL